MSHDVRQCRSCQAPVIFVPSAVSRQLMILDAEPNAKGNVRVLDGKAHVVKKGDLFEASAGGELFMPHHASCKDVAEWRRSKK